MPFRRKMRRMTLFGTAMALVLTLAIVVPAFGAPPTTVLPLKNHHKIAPPLTKGMTLTISGSGTAFKIADQSKTQSASISLTAKVERVSFGRALLNFTGGTLTIGSETFTVVGGHGILNFHSHKMVLHIDLKDSTGKQVHLILYGKNAHVPSPFNAGDHFSADFVKHRSKLAHQWFLDLKATVTRNS
jgi:hypothetical protein